MAFEDTFRLSCHAVIVNESNEVLLLKASYGDCSWGLPGGAIDPGETIHETLYRECKEELGCGVSIQYLSGVYYHQYVNSQAFIFRCELLQNSTICLSEEHTEYCFMPLSQLSAVQRNRVDDCLNFDGAVKSEKF